MDNEINKYLDLQEHLMHDGQYTDLLREYRQKQEAFLSVLAALEPKDRDAIQDFLGVCTELHTKMLLLACEG